MFLPLPSYLISSLWLSRFKSKVGSSRWGATGINFPEDERRMAELLRSWECPSFLLVAGGSKEAEVFDPASGTFLIVSGRMDNAWHYLTETKLRDGSVLLAGGYPDSDHTTAQTWIYRP